MSYLELYHFFPDICSSSKYVIIYFWFNPIVVRECILHDFNTFKLFMAYICLSPKIHYVHLKRMHVLFLLDVALYNCQLYKGDWACFSALTHLCLVLSIAERDMLKSTMSVELSIYLFNSVNFCFMYFEGLLLGTYSFIIIMSS